VTAEEQLSDAIRAPGHLTVAADSMGPINPPAQPRRPR
jgi:hypothetical protein